MTEIFRPNSLLDTSTHSKDGVEGSAKWCSFDHLIPEEQFAELSRSFPELELFEKHTGIPRGHDQRPHDRWYLALEHSIYGDKACNKGCTNLSRLSPCWQSFINELKTAPEYRKMLSDFLGTENFTLRFAWHVAGKGYDVSPHIDSPDKAGTHIFYFNTEEDWKKEWGGETVILGQPKTQIPNPEISDFGDIQTIPMLGNKSVIFKNSPTAWHGVAPLQCDAVSTRKIFNVIIEYTHDTGRLSCFMRRVYNRAKHLFR